MRIADLSANNTRPINHAALRAAGITGEVVKATESTDYVNPFFGTDYEAALAAGQVPGAYHFDHWLEALNPQLTFFAHHYGRRNGDIAPWWDLESYRLPNGHWAVLGADMGWAQVVDRCKAVKWCLTVAYGDGLIYCTRDTAAHLIRGGFDPMADLVIAQGSAGPLMAARIMQFNPVSIPGQSGLVDWSAA